MAKSKSLAILFSALLVLSCAKQEAPSGGPKDKQPPTIVETYPFSGTVNFDDNKIEVKFSEYIDKSSVRNSVFVSPNIDRLKFDWSGKTLEVKFLDSLKKNTTYTVTFGTGIKDLNEKNEMAESFSLVFSTGNKIDKGEISGYVFNRKPEGIMIFGYKLTDSSYVNPGKQAPDYITQTGKNGFFMLSGLGSSEYALFAVGDANSNNLYDDGERIGFTYSKVLLPNDSAKLSGVNFMLTVIDTIRPELDEITMTDKNHILLEFSEPIDSSKLFPENFQIIDSTSGEKFPVKFAYKGKVKRNKALISFADSLNGEHSLYLSVSSIFDKRGNELKNTVKEIFFNDKPDTLKPKILYVRPAFSDKKLNFVKPEFYLLFDDGVNLTSEALEFTDAKQNAIPLKIFRINDSEFKITPLQKLRSNSTNILKVNFALFSDAAGNFTDSVFTYKLETLDEIDLVSVEGKIDLQKTANDVYILLDNLKTTLRLKKLADKNGNFKFKSVPPGNYYVWAFKDENKNGKYDFGSLEKHTYSEKFTFRSDTLKVRPRWPIKNVNLSF